MAKHSMYLLFAATLMTSMTACADESAPNRRGIERPLLNSQHDVENAEKRETETHKREVPAGSGQEFPGQSRGDDAGASVVTLDVSATTPAATSEQPGQPATMALVSPAEKVLATQPEPRATKGMQSEKRPYAVPGKTMIVPDTGGEVIPRSWGEPVVLASYPHRAYRDKAVSYQSGDTLHNPYYYHWVYKHDYDPMVARGARRKDDTNDLVEIPWFYGQTIALPVLLVLDGPWSEKRTAWTTGDPLYLGGLPGGGEVVPAPGPGEIHYTYPFSTTQPSYETQTEPAAK